MTKLEERTIENKADLLELELIQVFGILAGTMIHEQSTNASLHVKGIATDDHNFDFEVTCKLIEDMDNSSYWSRFKGKFLKLFKKQVVLWTDTD